MKAPCLSDTADPKKPVDRVADLSDRFLKELLRGYVEADRPPADAVLLAVSGGADSVALLHGTLALRDQLPGRLAVAHINHHLRGAESDADAEFVKRLAETAELEFFLKDVPAESLQQNNAGSLEAAARSVRYEFLKRTAVEQGIHCVVTAHHRDDQAETILHHILRGTGLRGLAGMQPSRLLSPDTDPAGPVTVTNRPASQTRLLRPMLAVSRQEIQTWLTERGLPFRNDSSNQQSNFTRNRIRQSLLPLLKSDFNAQADRNLVALGQQTAEALQVLDDIAEQILDRSILEEHNDSCRLKTEALCESPPALVRHALTLLWTRRHWPRQQMTRRHWDRLAAAAVSGTSVSHDFPGGFRAECDGRMLRMFRSGC
ncbi:MAG: tRNA lysidine(34) synthetase TilS [Planctomycetaceae bacterium]|nr:tRNA lysidine(34) synthetase TilS [Planctomycetaceae bacterium]